MTKYEENEMRRGQDVVYQMAQITPLISRVTVTNIYSNILQQDVNKGQSLNIADNEQISCLCWTKKVFIQTLKMLLIIKTGKTA